MSGAGIAIDAAVLAAAIGIDAGVEADIGAVVVGNDCARRISKELSSRRGAIRFGFRVRFILKQLKTIGRIRRSPAAADWRQFRCHVPSLGYLSIYTFIHSFAHFAE